MVFFFYGPNTFASRRKLQDMVQTYVKKSGSDFGLQRLDGTTTNLKELVSALEAVPFLANSRLVIIENLSKNKALTGEIDKIAPRVPDTTVALFYESDIDKRGKFFKYLKDNSRAIQFEQLGHVQLRNWVRSEFKKLSASTDSAAVERLIEIVGDDQWRLEQEILKLGSYGGDISRQTVNELVVVAPSQSIFELVEAVVAGNYSKALATYRDLLDQQMAPHYVLSMVAWQLRNLLLAKAAGSISAADLAKAAGMSPYVAGKVLSRQSDYSEESLKKAFQAVIDADYGIKSGAGEAEIVVENLIIRLSQQQRA